MKSGGPDLTAKENRMPMNHTPLFFDVSFVTFSH
jgi:hypothetical protein